VWPGVNAAKFGAYWIFSWKKFMHVHLDELVAGN